MGKIKLKSRRAIGEMRRSSEIASKVLQRIGEAIAPGVSTYELDRVSREAIKEFGAKSSFLGYKLPNHPPYPATICASIDEEIVHGIPRKDRLLENGQIISIDTAVSFNGFHGDNAFTFAVGEISDEAQQLIDATKASLRAAIELAKPGNRLGDVCHAVQNHVGRYGFTVARSFVGHGIGRRLHEEPQVPNDGDRGKGIRLKPGMVLAIEPMVNVGSGESIILDDGWTAITEDLSLSAHFEHTVAITSNGPEILTENPALGH